MWGKTELRETYTVGIVVTAWPTAFVTFLGCWTLAIWKFGWWLGLPLGWMPALIVAGIAGYVAGLLWPLLVISVLALVWFFLRMGA